jgi:hypothetical protein
LIVIKSPDASTMRAAGSYKKGMSGMEYLYVVTGLVAIAGVFAVIQKTSSSRPKSKVTRLDL